MTSRRYLSALGVTLDKTAAAYGYTLTTATTMVLLSTHEEGPDELSLFLFAGGGLMGFLLLEVLLHVSGRDTASPGTAFPFAGALNFFSCGAGLGSADLVSWAIGGPLTWFLAPMVATVAYMLVVAAQVHFVDADRSANVEPEGDGPGAGE